MNFLTQSSGHTLDLVITQITPNLVLDLQAGSQLSDHRSIVFNLNCCKPSPPKKEIVYRKINEMDIEQFKHELSAQDFGNDIDDV